jgi:hypothetical protein
MGDALVVTTVPDEAWMAPMGEKRPAAAGGQRRRSITWGIEAGDVWEPPGEPVDRYGVEWYRNPAARRAHRKAVQESLERFLNERLARLYHMVRTGWWVLGRVRVRVIECRPVPEREMRRLVRSLHHRRTDTSRPRGANRSARGRSKRNS